MLFKKQPPIFGVIDEYTAWKYERHPMIAGGRRSLLYRFVEMYGVRTVEEITDMQVAFFVGEELSAFYAEQAMKALREFFHYCHLVGYEVISWRMVTEPNLRKVGRKTDWEMVKEVKRLREQEGRGLSFEAIAAFLTQKLNRKVHKTSAVRWYKQASRLP